MINYFYDIAKVIIMIGHGKHYAEKFDANVKGLLIA